ncbi:MAG TPA: hypothetical protein VE978_01895 [Chitinophagales bacterium]|nr:hypothetical protein [Chitinophagales bacterium]
MSNSKLFINDFVRSRSFSGKKILFLLLLLNFSSTILFAQKKSSPKESSRTKQLPDQPPYTQTEVRLQGFDQAKKLQENSLVSQVVFRNVGPTIMSGRVVDVDANPDNSTEFYVAYASGGVWYTNNNGVSFTPVFDHEAVLTIGDIAVDWKRNIIWVGTGENNSSRTSYSGVGIFKSSDAGKNWIYLGLGETHHIGRIVLDEDNPNNVWVASLGHLYSQNKERGIFKTTDGGKTWRQTLAINDSTGCIDIVRDPNTPTIFYASAWQRNRRAWNFQESGRGSGIYKSEDNGETWKLVTTAASGFPTGDGVGRIGLAAMNVMSPYGGYTVPFTIIYASLDNQFRREKKVEDTSKLTKNMLRDMSGDVFMKLSKKKVEDFLSDNFPEKYTADTIFTLIKSGKITPHTLVEYLEDANSLLFDTDVKGAELYRSDDGGVTWKKTHEGYLDDMFYTYGYYFSQVRTVKNEPDKVYMLGFVDLMSDDGGKTFHNILKENENVHVDNHAMWVDPNHEGHLVIGNDGGVNITYDDGVHWVKCNNPPVGQFVSVNYDMEEPYNVYGGLQDNGVWMGPSDYKPNTEWHQTGQYPYKAILDGDGMQVAVDTRGNSNVYTGFQFGNYFKVNTATNSTKYITPKHELGERPYRWNWDSPIWISQHNQDIVYFGANKVWRALNDGSDFKVISPDLTNGGKKGDVPYGTITTLHESPLKFGLIYAGTDDGNIWMTKDGGDEWKKISDALPKNLWVSRVWSSIFKEGRVYASLNGYRWDDFNPYLFVSEDYGTTWMKIGNDLPLEPINVVKEDPVNENILYVGTDNGVYVSLDRGKTFMAFTNGLPRVAVHDLAIHPRDHDLILGTHGRSIYIASVKELEQLRDSVLQKPLYVFDLEKKTYRESWGRKGFTWDSIKGPEIKIPFYLSAAGKISVSVYSDSNLVMKKWNVDGVKGLNYIQYDLSFDSTLKSSYETWLNKDVKEESDKVKLKSADNKMYYLHPGKYRILIEANAVKAEKTLVIEKPK